MKIKVSEATPLQLDWLVAKIRNELLSIYQDDEDKWQVKGIANGKSTWLYCPTRSWAQGGPIVERELIQLTPHWYEEWANKQETSIKRTCGSWNAFNTAYGGTWHNGPTPLIAAMRCYVASKLGDEVEVPEDLI